VKTVSRPLTIVCLIVVAAAVVAFNLRCLPLSLLEGEIYRHERETMFYEKLEDEEVRCGICFRNCVIGEGQVGFCRNRKNVGGTLYNMVYGRPSAVHIDPVEKEPQHHFLPDTQMLCIGTAGCNFRCKFCQNWTLSQHSLDDMKTVHELSPEQLVQKAVDSEVPSISFTYNEPTVLYEYMYDTAKLAQERGIRVMFHTNGAMNPEPLRQLLKYIDTVTVDLKGFDEQFYRDISEAELQPVLQTLKIIRREGVWLEIVNLVVPTLNDDPESIRAMCRWIKENLGSDVPLHFSRFFPAYRLTDLSPTPITTLEQAHCIAREEGLRFVSIGNVPGHEHNSTFCPECDEPVIRRHHFTVLEINVDEEGDCRNCGASIPGIWE